MDRMARFIEIVSEFQDILEWQDFCMTRRGRSFNEAAYYITDNEIVDVSEIDMASGCTKGCIMDWDNDYVYKIGFLDAVDNEDSEYTDYCAREYDLYCQMNADSEIPQYIFDIFVPVDFVGNYTIELDGKTYSIPIYGQAAVEVDEDRVYTTSFQNYCDSGDHTIYSDEELEDQWEYLEEFEQVEFCFPTEIYGVFSNYHINDVHASNVGYINGKLRIFDYAGYGIL